MHEEKNLWAMLSPVSVLLSLYAFPSTDTVSDTAFLPSVSVPSLFLRFFSILLARSGRGGMSGLWVLKGRDTVVVQSMAASLRPSIPCDSRTGGYSRLHVDTFGEVPGSPSVFVNHSVQPRGHSAPDRQKITFNRKDGRGEKMPESGALEGRGGTGHVASQRVLQAVPVHPLPRTSRTCRMTRTSLSPSWDLRAKNRTATWWTWRRVSPFSLSASPSQHLNGGIIRVMDRSMRATFLAGHRPQLGQTHLRRHQV